MERCFRLQELHTLTTAAQDAELSIDLLPFDEVQAAIRVVVAGTGTLNFESALVRDDAAFGTDTVPATVPLNALGTTLRTINPKGRYLRWAAASLGGSPKVQIDIIARNRRSGAVAKVWASAVRTTTVTTLTLNSCLDVMPYRSLSFIVRRLGGTGGTLTVEHSAVLDPGAFSTLFTTTLSGTTNTLHRATDPLRWLRWSVDPAGTTSAFSIEFVGRESL